MSISINFTFTQKGQAAVFNAQKTGTALNLTHIQLGSGNKAPAGTELALVTPQQVAAIAAGSSVSTTQIRMSAIFGGTANFNIGEIGLWSGDPAVSTSILVAYWSQASGFLAVKSNGVDFVFSHDMVLNTSVPPGSITILADQAQSAMLAAINNHQSAADPHPQYTTDAEVMALIEARVGDYVVAGGTANAITAVLVPAITGYNANTSFAFKAAATNTAAVTLDAGGGAKPLVREDGTPMQAGDVLVGMVVTVVYDVASTSFLSTEMVQSQVAGQIARVSQTQANTACTTAGTAPAFTASPTPQVSALSANVRLRMKFHTASTGADTLNVSGFGAKSLKQYDSTGAKVAGAFAANQLVDVEFDGTDFVLLDPLPPAVIGLPTGYKSGLILANNATNPSSQIDFGIGKARSASDNYDLSLGGTITKTLQASGIWTAGTNQNGLFSGAKAVNTWYHCFLIRKDADGSFDVGFDTSITAANKPAGYSNYRRVGSVRTDASGNVIAFVQVGSRFLWKTPPIDLSNTSYQSGTTNTYVISVPTGLKVLSHLKTAVLGDNSYWDVVDPDTNALSLGTYTAYTGGLSLVGSTSVDAGAMAIDVTTNTSAQIRIPFINGSGATGSVWVETVGWTEIA